MLNDVLFAIAMLVLFWDAIGLINRWYGLKKHGFQISPGLIMWRTKRGLNFIDRVARISKHGWRVYGTVAAAIGIFLMVFIFVNLIVNLVFVLTQPVKLPGIMLVYPGLIPWLPVVPWLVAVASLLVVHEFSHGVLLRAQGLKTKSVGAFGVVVMFGAFVEPDEKELMSAPSSKRLRVFAAGSMGNVIFGCICLVAILLLLVPKPGVYVYAVAENYPAENLTLGARIYQLDNVHINTLDDYYNFLENKRPGDNILVATENETIYATLVRHPENENRGALGLWTTSAVSGWKFANPLFTLGAAMSELLGDSVFHPYVYGLRVPWAAIEILKWMFVLNLGVGLFNMLPAVPLDGGYMMQAILERKFSKEKSKKAVRVLSYLVLVLILMNIAPGLMR
ncbi:MAG TPA: hypothetical protein EYP46_00330 [Hadesarchaea archaeon]|nr:hypothetical protein [Hadesarchaea archaeon]